MIHVKLIGGLGNQLFQIAFAYDLSMKLGQEISVDTSQYETYKVREFDLDKLNISEDIKFQSGNDKKFNILSKTYRLYQKIYKTLSGSDSFGKLLYKLGSRHGYFFNFDPYFYPFNSDEIKKLKSDIYLYGYFQSERYFEDSSSDLKSLLKVKTIPEKNEKKYLDLISSEECIALSMRLGEDYFNCNVLSVCDEDYYLDAIKKITTLVGNLNVIVFSDEIELAKKLLKSHILNFSNVSFIENMNATQSLRLMYSCDHFIIPNSSFSWWGAYLSSNPNKVIISPDRWYNYNDNVDDIYFRQMRRINEV